MSKMTTCKICSKEIAKSAKSCPHCGAKLKMGFVKKIGIGFLVLIGIGVVGSMGSDNDSQSTTSTQQTTNDNNPKEETKKEEPKKPTWNTTETDIEANGNIDIAVDLIKSSGDIKPSAESPEPAALAKAPWNYYGKIIKVTGIVNDIIEYPIGSDWSKLLGGKEAGQIVISTFDGSIVDMLVVGSTGTIKNGDTVTLYGYPIGLSDVDNRLGGKTTQVFIVGNAFDKQ